MKPEHLEGTPLEPHDIQAAITGICAAATTEKLCTELQAISVEITKITERLHDERRYLQKLTSNVSSYSLEVTEGEGSLAKHTTEVERKGPNVEQHAIEALISTEERLTESRTKLAGKTDEQEKRATKIRDLNYKLRLERISADFKIRVANTNVEVKERETQMHVRAQAVIDKVPATGCLRETLGKMVAARIAENKLYNKKSNSQHELDAYTAVRDSVYRNLRKTLYTLHDASGTGTPAWVLERLLSLSQRLDVVNGLLTLSSQAFRKVNQAWKTAHVVFNGALRTAEFELKNEISSTSPRRTRRDDSPRAR